jgi:opacity protein-like surface antigen
LGISQNVQSGGVNGNVKTPNITTYSGNVVFSASRSSVVPYATGGIGGLTLLETPSVGIATTKTFLTGNVGGGVKWFANQHWGLRADYRFLMVQSKDDAPAFFGRETRYGHRIYGAVVLNTGR